MIDIIDEFVKSLEMRDYYKNNPLTKLELIDLIINAPVSIGDKEACLAGLPAQDEYTSSLIDQYCREIDFAWCELLHFSKGAVFNLIEYWYDDEILCEKHSSGELFLSFEAAVDHIHQTIAEEEWNDDSTCWTVIEKWVPAENGKMMKTYDYTLIRDMVVGFHCFDTESNIIICGEKVRRPHRSYLDVNLNLPIPFSPGDIVALDCRPFAPVKPALLLEVSDDCCGVQMLYEHDGMLNMDVYDTAALKHGHGYKDAWEHEYLHPLSYLYKLRRIDVPDDFVNISREWDEKQFRAILPFMQQVIRDNRSPEVSEDVLKKYYLAKYQIIRQTGEAGK